jgi:hypothetical protein
VHFPRLAQLLLLTLGKKQSGPSAIEENDMLSHIVNLVNGYQTSNGVRPNLVYMNETHYAYLREELPGIRDHMDLVSILGVDIALSEEAIQPSVATVRFGDENILVS